VIAGLFSRVPRQEMSASHLPAIGGANQPALVTSAMKESFAVRAGPRRGIFGVRPNEKFYEEKRQIGLKTMTQFPFTGAEKYVGDWKDNFKEGFGTQTWTKGHKYEGEWVASKRTGKGIYFVCEGGSKMRKQYTGDWFEDQKHGVGVFIAKNGDRYEGEWRFNCKHGMGKVFYGPGAQETSYNGSWAEGKRAGLGILELKNGDRFEGHWKEDKREGPGRYFYKSTNKVYEGEWVGGMPKCGQYRDAPFGSFPEDQLLDDGSGAGLDRAPENLQPDSGGSVGSGGTGSRSSATDGLLPVSGSRFSIPALRLLAPEAVVSEAVTSIRQASAAQTNDMRSFNPEEVDILRQCFAEYDPDETGYIYCGDLFSLLGAAGLDVAATTVGEVVASLEADAASQLNFAEFVDVAAILIETERN